MKLLRLCADERDPRQPCRAFSHKTGWTCRCEGRYPVQRAEHWRPPSPGEAAYYCRRCGRMCVVTEQRVDYWTCCINCRFEFRVKGTSFVRTWCWHLFGRHEGYNSWSLWKGWL